MVSVQGQWRCLFFLSPSANVGQEGRQRWVGGRGDRKAEKQGSWVEVEDRHLEVLAIEAGMTSSRLAEFQLCLRHPHILILQGY